MLHPITHKMSSASKVKHGKVQLSRRICHRFPIVNPLMIVAALCSLTLAAGCSTVKETGRKRMILLSSKEELSLGEMSYRQSLSQHRPSKDPELTALVRRVGSRVAEASGFKNFKWEYSLLDSNAVNATCAPGGKIVVYTGILTMMANEAQLAAVLGHEVAHATARHSAERITKQTVAGTIASALASGVQQAAPNAGTTASAAIAMGAQVGFLLPYSRLHEAEADEIGLMYMARAGYDPREAAAFWERMEEASKRQTKRAEFLSTHPSDSRRIHLIREQLPAAMEVYSKATNKYGLGATIQLASQAN